MKLEDELNRLSKLIEDSREESFVFDAMGLLDPDQPTPHSHYTAQRVRIQKEIDYQAPFTAEERSSIRKSLGITPQSSREGEGSR